MNDALTNRGDHYLELAVQTASPAKLRLMLIERGVDVAKQLAAVYRESADSNEGVNEHSIKLLEILNELLGGVTDKELPVSKQISDLYVFLCQHLLKAEENRDASCVDEIRLVLETEAETWRMVCTQESPVGMAAAPVGEEGGLDFCG